MGVKCAWCVRDGCRRSADPWTFAGRVGLRGQVVSDAPGAVTEVRSVDRASSGTRASWDCVRDGCCAAADAFKAAGGGGDVGCRASDTEYPGGRVRGEASPVSETPTSTRCGRDESLPVSDTATSAACVGDR